MAYKKLIKVSNVCQLLDKSKYPATYTKAGVTVTNNGDGTITANGNCTYILNTNITEFDKFTIKAKHKYLILDSSGSTSRTQYSTWVKSEKGGILLDSVSMPIGGITYNDNKCTVYIRINNGVSVSNLVFKPQLFDLTEMYGAGNEPTTVEQFRQDFPEEMYDYSPYCWLTSYKRVFMTGGGNYLTSYQRNLTCKTKNLLPYPYYETTITRNGVTFTDNRDGTITINGTSTGFATFVFSKNYNFIAGNTYYVSTPYSIIAYKENGTIYYIQGNKSFTWSSNCEVVQIYMQINKGITLNNLKIYPMINLGDTATDYVPYGHL